MSEHATTPESTPSFARAAWLRPWLDGRAEGARWWRVVAFVMGLAAHLWLADAWHQDWIVADALMVIGALGLLITRGGTLAWAIAALGAMWPVWFARDHLTQSVLLAALGAAQAVGAWHDARRPRTDDHPGAEAAARFGWAMTWITYALAALHKLNADFLNPETSCAVYGLDKTLTYWHLRADAALTTTLAAYAPHLTLVMEGGIVALYLLRRRRAALILAIAFHIPLTVTMAPAFVFVMLAGHACALTDEDTTSLTRTIRAAWPRLAVAATLLTTLSLWRHGAWPEPLMVPKEWWLWLCLATLLLDTGSPRALLAASPPPPLSLPPRSTRARRLVSLAALLFALHGLTPYLGVQFHHTGAMLSNLRIDAGCWNHLLIPEAARLTDDAIRITHASLRTPSPHPNIDATLTEHLWSPPQLLQMRRNWCPGTPRRTLRLQGTYRHKPFTIEDLCAPDLATTMRPFTGDGILGVSIFPDYLRYQKNLKRACPQTCIH